MAAGIQLIVNTSAAPASPVGGPQGGPGGAGHGPSGGAGGGPGGHGSDKVVDADFEEVDDQKKRGSA